MVSAYFINQYMQSKFLTDRLSLDIIDETDYVFVRTLVNTAGWLEFIGDREVHSDEDARHYIQKIKNTSGLFYWVVKRKNDETALGIVSFLKRHYLDHFDLGFAFLPEFEGYGYAFEAARTVLYTALKQKAHNTVLATTFPANIKSIRLLEKLGFVFMDKIKNAGHVLLLYRINAA